MHFTTFCLGLLAVFFQATNSTPIKSHATSCNATTKFLHQFSVGTWIENIAVRSNGQLLVTLLTTPDLYLIDPFTSSDPVLVNTFPFSLGLTGIAEVTPDTFILTSTNFSLATGITPNSSIAWKIDLSHSPLTTNDTNLSYPSKITKIASLDDLTLPNGLCTLSSHDKTVLIGDIRTGQIYTLDTVTGSYYPSISNSFTAPAPQADFGPSGINGIHVRDQTLYFANTGLGIFASIPIHRDGSAAGDVNVISTVLEGDYMDDFSLRGESSYLVTGSGNSIEWVRLNGSWKGRAKIVVGGVNSTTLAEPTAVAWGRTERDKDVLYVVTAGGLATPVIEGGEKDVVGGQVVAVDFGGCW